MDLLSCEHVCLGYDGRELLHDINFSVKPGDYLCIVGENGAGKSTLMRTLLGLRAPLHGRIIRDPSLAGSGIGYLPQQTEVQRDFPASVWEVVLSGCQNRLKKRPFYSKADKAFAEEKLRLLHLEELKKACYRELSGGQQQRVLLARALCAAGKILLLDEPVSGLDPVVTRELYALIEELNKKHGMTIIMISHDISAVMHSATHVLQLGKHVYFGARQAYMEGGHSFAGKETK